MILRRLIIAHTSFVVDHVYQFQQAWYTAIDDIIGDRNDNSIQLFYILKLALSSDHSIKVKHFQTYHNYIPILYQQL